MAIWIEGWFARLVFIFCPRFLALVVFNDFVYRDPFSFPDSLGFIALSERRQSLDAEWGGNVLSSTHCLDKASSSSTLYAFPLAWPLSTHCYWRIHNKVDKQRNNKTKISTHKNKWRCKVYRNNEQKSIRSQPTTEQAQRNNKQTKLKRKQPLKKIEQKSKPEQS